MKLKRSHGMALVLMGVFILTRWPGLMPPNFSAAYGLIFCAGVYFRGELAWWIPLATMAVADGLLGFYYWHESHIPLQWYQLTNYPVYLVLLGLGRWFRPRDSWGKLVGGGVLGAILFYFLTNTAAWFFNPFGNPEYSKTLEGWWRALTLGTAGHPSTWEFLLNTLLSGGLFTGLFVGAMKAVDVTESAAEKATANVPAREAQEEGVGEPEAPESTA
ncbi:MAG: hypothetical protein HYR88_07580 [Verrucomicrobia bacterium]|nr:hypothetical protein [Verrucomicrobiota bacterium]MBI3871048.1 hypothetical protein [Verrucomicrobiota bacterium]